MIAGKSAYAAALLLITSNFISIVGVEQITGNALLVLSHAGLLLLLKPSMVALMGTDTFGFGVLITVAKPVGLMVTTAVLPEVQVA